MEGFFVQMDDSEGPEGGGLAAHVLPLADGRHLRPLRHRAVVSRTIYFKVKKVTGKTAELF